MDAPSSKRWDLLPLAGLLALATLLAWRWPHLPAQVATHFDAAGQPNGWTPKPALPFVILGMPTLLWGILGLASRSSARRQPALAGLLGPFRALFVLGIQIIFGDLLLGGPGWGTAFGVGCILVGAVLMIQRALRLAQTLPPDDRYRAGAFFYDAADPRIFVPKRLGLGWTLNFGRPAAWLVMVLLLGLPVIALLLARPR